MKKKIKSIEISWAKGVNKLKRIHVAEWTAKDCSGKELTKTTDEQQDIINLIGCTSCSVLQQLSKSHIWLCCNQYGNAK